MDLQLNIKLYKGAGGKQNIWVEKNHGPGIRYEINSIDDICKIFEKIIKEIID